jgi:hypothetical protein
VVNPSDRLARFLGGLMIAGSIAGVLLSLAAMVLLVVLGEVCMPWPMDIAGWWSGGHPVPKFLVGLGILILGATPVIMLAAFLARALKERRWITVLAASGLFVVLAFGLLQVLG